MFITFEGTEGCGKSSQIPPLAEFLRQQGFDVLTTREPGGTAIGDQIRAILADMENTAMRPRTEMLLFQASRAQHVDEVIVPALAAGRVVLCDRFADSTLAYQGYGHQKALDPIREIINYATGGLNPDLTFLLDLSDVQVGLQRRATDGEWNRLDAMQLAFHQRVREGYYRLVEAQPERWVVIDAEQTFEMVQVDLRRVALERLHAVHSRT
jgi:dTMP kinase